jgi:hypothetical protein
MNKYLDFLRKLNRYTSRTNEQNNNSGLIVNGAESREQRAESREQRAESMGQRAWGREHGAWGNMQQKKWFLRMAKSDRRILPRNSVPSGPGSTLYYLYGQKFHSFDRH